MYQSLQDRQALRRVLTDDAEATPMYVLREMAQATLVDHAAQDRLLRGLFDALQHQLQKHAATQQLQAQYYNSGNNGGNSNGMTAAAAGVGGVASCASPHVLYKALHALRVLCETGHPSVQQQLQRVAHTEVLRALTRFCGVADATCGDAYNERVRSEANAVMTAAFAPPRALPTPSPPSTTTTTMTAIRGDGSGAVARHDDAVHKRGNGGGVLESLAHVTRDAVKLLTQHEALRAQQGGVGAHDFVYERDAQRRGNRSATTATTAASAAVAATTTTTAASALYAGKQGGCFLPITLHTHTRALTAAADSNNNNNNNNNNSAFTATPLRVDCTRATSHADATASSHSSRRSDDKTSSEVHTTQQQLQQRQHAALARLVRTTTTATHAPLSRVELTSFVHACRDYLARQQQQQQQHALLVPVGDDGSDVFAALVAPRSADDATTTTTADVTSWQTLEAACVALCDALAEQLDVHVTWQHRLNALLCIEALLQAPHDRNNNNSCSSDNDDSDSDGVMARCARHVRDYFAAHRACIARQQHVAQATLRQRACALLECELGGATADSSSSNNNNNSDAHNNNNDNSNSTSAATLSLRGMTVRPAPARTAARPGGAAQHTLDVLFAGDAAPSMTTQRQQRQQRREQQPCVSTDELFSNAPVNTTRTTHATAAAARGVHEDASLLHRQHELDYLRSGSSSAMAAQQQQHKPQRRASQVALAEAEALMRAQLASQPLP